MFLLNFMQTKSKLKARRVDGEIQLRRYGKWYDTESLNSLAAYKFNAFGNGSGLRPNVDYSGYDIKYIQPTFRFTGNHNHRKGVIAPTGFFHYLMEDGDLECDFETAKRLFVAHPIVYGRSKYYNNYGDVDGLIEDEWYPMPKDAKREHMIQHYTHLPFAVHEHFNYIEFTLKQGVFIKWDDDVEDVIGKIELTVEDDTFPLHKCTDLMSNLVLEDVF